jgi:hypothetical protein
MGGYPPIDGPYAAMLRVTMATHEMSTSTTSTPPSPSTDQPADEYDWSSAQVTMSEPQTRQFMTLYRALQHFDDRAAQVHIACPRLCFVGSNDEIAYGERWGDVVVRIAEPLIRQRTELERYGWQVHVLDGLDHIQAMQVTTALPILRPWLTSVLGGRGVSAQRLQARNGR